MASRIAILGAGFIGRNLLASYGGTGHHVRVLDRNPCPADLGNGVQWVQGLFGEADDVRRAIKGVDVVFHLVSSTVPADAVDENEEIMSNVAQTINLLKLCVQEGVRRIVFISSASVYGIKRDLPIGETAATDPISSHGIHKLTIEKYLQLYRYKHGLDCKIMRLSNPYGGGQNVSGRQGIVAIGIGKILSGEPITIMGNGNAIRDFIHIDDVIRACQLLAETSSDEAVFNIGSGKGMSVNSLFHELQKFTRTALNLRYIEGRKTDISASVLDVRKAKEILGFEAEIPFGIGLQRTLMQYAKRHPGLQEVLNLA